MPDTLEVDVEVPRRHAGHVLAVQRQRRARPTAAPARSSSAAPRARCTSATSGYEIVPERDHGRTSSRRAPRSTAALEPRRTSRGRKAEDRARKKATAGRHAAARPQLPRLREEPRSAATATSRSATAAPRRRSSPTSRTGRRRTWSGTRRPSGSPTTRRRTGSSSPRYRAPYAAAGACDRDGRRERRSRAPASWRRSRTASRPRFLGSGRRRVRAGPRGHRCRAPAAPRRPPHAARRRREALLLLEAAARTWIGARLARQRGRRASTASTSRSGQGGHVLPERAADDLPRAVEAAREEGLDVPMITTALTSADDPTARPILSTAGGSASRTSSPATTSTSARTSARSSARAGREFARPRRSRGRVRHRGGLSQPLGLRRRRAVGRRPVHRAARPEVGRLLLRPAPRVRGGRRAARGRRRLRLVLAAAEDDRGQGFRLGEDRQGAGRTRTVPLGEGMVDWDAVLGESLPAWLLGTDLGRTSSTSPPARARTKNASSPPPGATWPS